jgi:hypothetical protein
MTITIRQAKIEDAFYIVEAEREIAQEPGYFCSQLRIFIYGNYAMRKKSLHVN